MLIMLIQNKLIIDNQMNLNNQNNLRKSEVNPIFAKSGFTQDTNQKLKAPYTQREKSTKNDTYFDERTQRHKDQYIFQVRKNPISNYSQINDFRISSPSKFYDNVVTLSGDSKKSIESLRRDREEREMRIMESGSRKYLSPSNYKQEESDKKIKRLEGMLKVKSQEIFFKIKVKVSNLLEEFEISKSQIGEVVHVKEENEIFDFMSQKLRNKLRDIKNKERELTQQDEKNRILLQKQQQNIRYLKQSLEILKSSETRAKQKTEEIKKQWNLCCERLLEKQKQIEVKDNQIFKLKRLYQDAQGMVLKLQVNEKRLLKQFEQQQAEADSIIKDLRVILSNYNIQKKQLSTQLQEKQTLCEQLMLKTTFSQDELDKANRQYVRWKERYQWLEREKEERVRSYETEMKSTAESFKAYRDQFNSEEFNNLKEQQDMLIKQAEYYRGATLSLEQELKRSKNLFGEIEEQYYSKIEHMEEEFKQKMKQIQQIQRIQQDEYQRNKQQIIKTLKEQYQRDISLRDQQITLQAERRLNKQEKQYRENINKLQIQNQDLKEEIMKLSKKNMVKGLNKMYTPTASIIPQESYMQARYYTLKSVNTLK